MVVQFFFNSGKVLQGPIKKITKAASEIPTDQKRNEEESRKREIFLNVVRSLKIVQSLG